MAWRGAWRCPGARIISGAMIRSRIFGAGALVAWLVLALAGPALAQSQPSAAPAPAPAAAPLSADELERLIGTLQDDAARGKLVEQLPGLIAAQRRLEQKQPQETPPTPLHNFPAR